MKILVFLEKSCTRGGIEIFAERQVAALRAANNEVTVSDEIKDGFDQIIVHKCSDIDTLEKFPPEKTVYYVHDHEPICPRGYAYTPFGHNCLRSGGIWPCLCCAPLCKRAKAAVARVLTQGRRKRAMARFGRIVVISEFMKSRLVANGIPGDHISVEPPEISFKACDEGATGALQSDLLFVGQLIRGKGVHLLLKAMSIMKTQRTLDIVGTGNMEGELKAMAKRLGLDGRVRFRGFQPNPQDWMRCAECIVVPSFWQEPYGLVAAEAASLGRKVVAFAIGGLPEAGQGKAILVPPGDVKALADALDSTMARFWWLKPESETKVREAFKAFAGHWLTEEETKRHGIYRADHKFGDAIFLADPGLQFCPSDMGIKPLNGMHGFDPADEDSLACWLSTEPVPDEVRRVCDYFREMTSRR